MRTTISNSACKSKAVLVGIDVHKRTDSVVARVEGTMVKKWTAPVVRIEELVRTINNAK
jgi:hypothetical protein